MLSKLAFAALTAVVFKGAFSAETGEGEWDFTGGTAPHGGTLRGVAVLTPKGLTVPDLNDYTKSGGFQLNEKFVYSDAFRFEMELVLRKKGDVIASEGAVWDDMYVNTGAKKFNTGMQVLLHRYDKKWTPVFSLGVGGRTCTLRGPSLIRKFGDTVKIAAVYDANRRLTIEFDGV